MDLDEAVAKLHEAGLVASRAELYHHDRPRQDPSYRTITGGVEKVVYSSPKPGEPIGETRDPFDIAEREGAWHVEIGDESRVVGSLAAAVDAVIQGLQPKTCEDCRKEFRFSGLKCHDCRLVWRRAEVKRLAAERRSKFTLFAKFLLAKDKAFESIGVTLEVLVNEGLDRKTGVVGYYLDLRDVVQAFEKEPNDRAAFKRGMDILPKLIGLLKSYRDQAEGLEPSWSALKPLV